nr:palindromic element RPE4 domain-containing protein [Rickettsia bellii]
MIYSRDPVKNNNKISIFYYFLDTVVKPRYDTKHVFRSTQQCRHGMTTLGCFSIHTGKASAGMT